ncbi:MAG: DUF1778 domain-containing protein [Gammaproteobacteria bacterium]|nr:DUF1778 domain-containing protein [Gammaproteobacteria bacterium]
MTTAALKEEYLSIRATPELKKLIATAATLSHESITDFMLSNIRKAAERVIAESETIVLNNEERDRFLALLDNPPLPDEALKAAAIRCRKHLHL